jgi:hypothetical protein
MTGKAADLLWATFVLYFSLILCWRSGDKIENEMGGACSAYGVLVGKTERKRLLGRSRHKWEDNIQMDVQEVGCGDMDWMELVQDRDRWWALVNAVMNLQVP